MSKLKQAMANPLFAAMAKRLFIASALSVALVFTAIAYAQDRYSCSVDTGGGGYYNYWLSCGSSAGNFWYRCDGAGNCDDCDTQACQDTADYQCSTGECP
jgi:hypothetical protein